MSHSEVNQDPEDVIAYWTPERMAEARPREIRLPEPGSEPADSAESAESEREAGSEQE